MTPPDTLTPAPPVSIAPAVPSDRADLAIETARQPGGTLDPTSWTVPTPERVAEFMTSEPDQSRVDAFAYSWLQDGSAAKATGTGGGIDQDFKAGLQAYVDRRKSRGEQPFQYLQHARTRAEERAAREQVPFFKTLFSDPEKMAEAFPAEQRQAFEARFAGSINPIDEKRQTAGILLVSSMLGKAPDEVADLWPAYRQRYGNEHLGISGKVDDATFYQAAGKAFEQETKDDETARAIAEKAQHAAIQGRPLRDAIATGKELTGDQWKRFEPAARAAYAGVLSEFSDREIKSGRALFESVADMEGQKVTDIATGDGSKAAWVVALEDYGRADQKTRDNMLALIGLQAQAEGSDISNYFERLGAAMQSGTDSITSGITALSSRSDVKYLEELASQQTDPETKKRFESQIAFLKGKGTFSIDLQTAGVRVRKYIDAKREGFWDSAGDYGVMAAESLPIMGAAALPYGVGLPAIMTSYAERDLSTYRRAAPNADESALLATAYTSGAIEAGIDRLEWLTLGARVPKLNAALLKYGKPGAVAVAAARAGFVTVAETGQEILQDLTPSAIQSVASALNEDIPGVQWETVLSNEAASLGDIAGVSLIFGVIGGAGSTITDHMQAPRVAKALQDRDGLALAGFSAATIEEVSTLAETHPAAAAEALKAAMIETPQEQRQANALEARTRLEAEAADSTANQDAGLPTLEKQADGKVQVNFPDGPAVLVDDNEQALQTVREWEDQEAVNVTKANREYIDFLTEFHASNPEATFSGKQTGTQQTLETWARNSKERIATANARIDIMLRQGGADMGIERPLLSDVPILGTSRNIRAGAVTRMVAEIHQGGNPLTVIEEAAEAVGKWLIADSKVSESKLVGWIRETEQQTRSKILSDDLANLDDDARAQEIAEGFSYIARNNAVGKIRDSALPSAVKAFFRAFKEQIASVLRIATDFAKLRTEGKVNPEFAYWLDVAAGLEPEFQHENLVRQMEAEMQAEAMAGFTELQDALKGKLPHPDTLEAAGDPLAGEVRRLWEGMMANPENGASKAARTRKTNEFFLPKSQSGNLDELRRSINAQGFDFQTPAELIEAADLSINYGRKQFGTTQADSFTGTENDWNPTFSISLRTDPLLAAIEANLKDPEKKAEVYQRMKARVSAVKRRFEERRLKGEFDKEAGGQIDRTRFEQIRDLATLEAIAKALPPDIRGKVVASFRKVADLKTAKAREAYLVALLPRIERALETSLQKHFLAAIRREFDRAAVNVSESRTRGGKVGAVAHAIIEQARAAMTLKPEQADASADKFRDELENAPTLSAERLEELDGKIAALELFQDFENADSARMAEGLKLLKDVRTEGRKDWLAVLAGRRDLRMQRIATFRAGLHMDRPIDFAERPRTKRNDEKLVTRLNEGFMEWMLSNSQKMRRLGELTDDPTVIATVETLEGDFLEAELAESDMNRADNEALAHAMRTIFGVSTEYAVAKKLRELTHTGGEIPVTKIEGFKELEISVPKHLVEAILRGEVNGFDDAKGNRVELDPHDITALETAWEKFSELEDTDQNRRRKVSFTRRVSKGERKTLGDLNQLEALQILLTMNQPGQGTKMETLGFDDTTRAELEAYLKPEVKALGAWMVDYLRADQGTIDALHRSEKGVGLGLVDEYFPIRNDVARADSGGLALNGQAVQQGGRSVSFIKERVTNYANPAVVNALAVFLSHRAQANFWKSHVSPIREWSGVIRDDGFAAAVKTRMGETYYQALARTMERIETGGTLNAKGLAEFERAMKGLLKTFALGTLGMRMSTILVNATAAMNVLFEVRADKLIKGALQLSKRPEAFKDAWNSPPIRRRLEEGATFETKIAKSSGPSDRPTLAMLNSWAEKGMFPINLADTGTNLIGAAIVWEDTRAEAVRAGVDPEGAKAIADAKVERLLLRSAQPTTRLARSEFEQRVLDNPLSAFFALFVSEPRKNLAITYMAVRELATGKGTYGKQMAAQQAFVGLAAYVAADFVVRSLYSAFAKADDKDEDELFARFWQRLTDAKAWGYQLATSHLKGIPVFGEFWNVAMAKTFEQPAFDKSPNPLLKLTTVPGNVEDLFTGTTGEQTKAATRIVQTLGTVIPGGSVFAQGGNLADFTEGLATSNGVSFSDEDRVNRLKSRFSQFKATLDDIHGKTTGPDGKTDKRIQDAKHSAMIDRLRADLAPLTPELRKQALEAVNAPKSVKESTAALLKK